MKDYEEIVKYLLKIPKFSSKNEANHTKSLLGRLGSPQEAFSIIHVAGTNGKGSVCAYCSSALCAAGKRVGMFTSPHLVRINERFRIQGEPVSDEMLVWAFGQVYPVIQAMTAEGLAHPTFFETLLALGMVIFKEEKVEWLLLETGLGGRLDATNVVVPKVTAITSVGMDHMEYLGNTLEEIAAEKAGIIKPGIPVVYMEGAPAVNRVICQKAEEKGALAYPVSRKKIENLKKTDKTIAFSVKNRYYGNVSLSIATIGDYQIDNALMAEKILEVSNVRITKEQLQKGFWEARWPGRMEEVLPGVFLDGAHNEPGIQAFLKTIMDRPCEGKRILLFAVVLDKDYQAMIEALCRKSRFDRIVVTAVEGSRGAESKKIAELFENCGSAQVSLIEDSLIAWETVLREREKEDEIYCVGSLYFIGALKRYLAACGGADRLLEP